MAKAQFGEFSAYDTPGGVRFQKNNKLVSEKALPPEVVSFLKGKISGERGEVQPESISQVRRVEASQPAPQFARPSEEELAKMRAESAAKLAGQPGEELKTLEAPMTEEDFETPAPQNVEQAETEPSAEQMHEVSELLAEHPRDETPKSVEELPPAKTHDVAEHPSERVARETRAEMSDYLETVSIHTATLEDIAEALYERFGIYTVYRRQLPQADEINPLTGVAFTKYHLGIAYQAAIFAANQGVLERSPEKQRAVLDEGRYAAENLPLDGQAHTVGENRAANTFAHRTSVSASKTVAQTRIVHRADDDGVVRAYQEEIPQEEMGGSGSPQRYDKDEDEQIVEPPIFGTKPTIRPNW